MNSNKIDIDFGLMMTSNTHTLEFYLHAIIHVLQKNKDVLVYHEMDTIMMKMKWMMMYNVKVQ